jgi:hypothetical protein
MTTFNGWTNRNTWVVNLYVGNDEGLYRAIGYAYKHGQAEDDYISLITQCKPLMNDLGPGGLMEVNWTEVKDTIEELFAEEE